MSALLQQVGSNLHTCFKRWEAVTLSPRMFFGTNDVKLSSTTFMYFVGMQLFAYILSISAMALFFGMFYLPVLRANLKGGALHDAVSNLTALFAVFCLLQFVLIFVTGFISYLPYRILASGAGLSNHVAALLYMTNLDPVLLLRYCSFSYGPVANWKQGSPSLRLDRIGTVYSDSSLLSSARLHGDAISTPKTRLAIRVRLRSWLCSYFAGFFGSFDCCDIWLCCVDGWDARYRASRSRIRCRSQHHFQ
jgi:hypothetical protein